MSNKMSKHEAEIFAIEMVPAAMAAAKAFGFEDDAMLRADHAIKTITGQSVLALLDCTTDSVPRNSIATYTPKELSERIDGGVSERTANKILQAFGLQYRDVNNNRWELTDKGKYYAEVLDTNKVQGGAPVKQIK